MSGARSLRWIAREPANHKCQRMVARWRCRRLNGLARRPTCSHGPQVFDQVVIDAGGRGSAAIHELAPRGQRVPGLEHSRSPRAGIIGGLDAHLLLRLPRASKQRAAMWLAFARWQALQHDFGETLLTVTNCLDIGLALGRVVSGAGRRLSKGYGGTLRRTRSPPRARAQHRRLPHQYWQLCLHPSTLECCEDPLSSLRTFADRIAVRTSEGYPIFSVCRMANARSRQ